MRICNRIFCQNPHIAYFSAYNGICKIAYAKIMPHIQNFAHICTYAIAFFSFFLVQRCFKTVKYFWQHRLLITDYYLQLDVECIKSKMSKLCRTGLLMIIIMILRHSKLHVPEICRKLCCIYATYFAKFRIFSCIFCFKKFRIFKKILCYKPASLSNLHALYCTTMIVSRL